MQFPRQGERSRGTALQSRPDGSPEPSHGRIFLVWVSVVVLTACGCGGQVEQSPDTGARDAARAFAEAIARQDWTTAYEKLHENSRARVPRDEFARRASRYWRNLGFEPASVQVRSCEEQGEEAKAHLVFGGQVKSGPRQFRDSFLLRRGPEGWGVILPPRFGQSRTR